MINTLRITSVVAAILAGVFLVFPVVYGVRSDQQIEKFLASSGIREKFENAADSRAKTNEDQVSPLVKQAQAFASYLNPKPKSKRAATGSKSPNIARKLAVTPKFKLRCTSYCEDDPNMSLALIDEPGKGRHWVRPSSKVGHLVVRQIKDGLIVVEGSEETFELKIEQGPSTSLSKKAPISSRRTSSQVRLKPTPSSPGGSSSGTGRSTSTAPEKVDDAERDARAKALIEKLRILQKSTVSDGANSGVGDGDKAARIEKLISQYQSTRVSPEEARKLGDLGKTLKDAGGDPNRTPTAAGKKQ